MLNSFDELLHSVSLVYFSDYGFYKVASSLSRNHFQEKETNFISFFRAVQVNCTSLDFIHHGIFRVRLRLRQSILGWGGGGGGVKNVSNYG